MALDLSCFDNIIGLSNTDCSCFDPKPAGYDTSDSGLFIDDVMSLKAIKDDCSNGTKWEILADARSEAYLAFYTDLLNAMRRNQRQTHKDFSGKIGNNSAGGNITTSNTHVGLKLWLNDIQGGVFTLKDISLWNANGGNVDVKVYSQEGDAYTLLNTYTVPTTANVLSTYTLPTPLEIDMYSHECEYKNVYLVYETAGLTIKNNAVHCGCGGKKNTVCVPPCFGWDLNQKRRWNEYTMVTGVEGDDLADLENWAENSEQAKGMMINTYFNCRILSGLCEIVQNQDHQAYMDIAYALQWSASSRAWAKVINGGDINRYTLMGTNECYGKRNHAQKEYVDKIEVLSKELSPELIFADCFECKSPLARRRIIK